MKIEIAFCAVLSAILLLSGCEAKGGNGTEEEAIAISSMIYNGKELSPILMDSEYAKGDNCQRSYNQILRAVGDLRQDIAMVTGAIDYKAVQRLT